MLTLIAILTVACFIIKGIEDMIRTGIEAHYDAKATRRQTSR
jgi:hypothetical protein